jgi:hypothetical protein
MKPGLETAIRELLADFDENGQLVGYPVDILRHVRALKSEFKIETGNSETVDIPVTDGQRKMTLADGTCRHEENALCKPYGCIPVRDGEK